MSKTNPNQQHEAPAEKDDIIDRLASLIASAINNGALDDR